MKDEIERALAPLIGRPVWAAGRASAMLWLHLGERRARPSGSSPSGDLAEFALHVSCPWRLIGREGIYTASGDYFTPADPDGDPADFDWDEPGASWCDLRLKGFIEETAESPQPVTGVSADDLGSLRLTLGEDFVLDVFPDSSHTDHVESEYWRLLQPASGGPHFVVGSEGLERVVET